jgi:tetratricopeptide (TPR) repeat protein
MKRGHAMKKVLILLVLAGFLSGCVTSRKYDELKKELTDYRQKNETISSDVKLLKQKNEDMVRELQKIRQVPEYYFRTGTDFYSKGQYGLALESFEKLVDRYPTDNLASQALARIAEITALSSSNYEKILKTAENSRDLRTRLETIDREMGSLYLTKADSGRLLKKRDEYLDELKASEEAARHILVEDDPTQSLKTYRTTRSTLRRIGYNKSFYVEIYAVHHYSGKKNLRLRTRYAGDKWISYDSLSIRGDNGVHADVVCKYPEKLSSMVGDRVSEWSDNDIDDDKVLKLSKSNTVTVRFSGGYKYTFEMTDEQLLSLREIIRKYHSLR